MRTLVLLAFSLGFSPALAVPAARADDSCLPHVAPTKGFAYFSGNAPNMHNHPAMYAWGVGDGAHVTVVGKGYSKEFPMKRFDEALAAYRELLRKQGYEPPEAPKAK